MPVHETSASFFPLCRRCALGAGFAALCVLLCAAAPAACARPALGVLGATLRLTGAAPRPRGSTHCFLYPPRSPAAAAPAAQRSAGALGPRPRPTVPRISHPSAPRRHQRRQQAAAPAARTAPSVQRAAGLPCDVCSGVCSARAALQYCLHIDLAIRHFEMLDAR
jgi:hypothetical protein